MTIERVKRPMSLGGKCPQCNGTGKIEEYQIQHSYPNGRLKEVTEIVDCDNCNSITVNKTITPEQPLEYIRIEGKLEL